MLWYSILILYTTTMMSAITVWRATGIWAMNKDAFTDANFELAEKTGNLKYVQVSLIDRAIFQGDNMPLTQELLEDEPGKKMPPGQPTSTRQLFSQPICSWMTGRPSSFATTSEQMMPLSKENATNKRVTKHRGKTEIILETPYKNELVVLKKATKSKEQKKR